MAGCHSLTYPRPHSPALSLPRPGHRDGCETVSRLWSVSGDASSNGRARGAWMRTPAVRPLTAAGPREASRQRAGCDYPRPADRNPAAQCGASRRLYSHCGRPRHRRAPHPTLVAPSDSRSGSRPDGALSCCESRRAGRLRRCRVAAGGMERIRVVKAAAPQEYRKRPARTRQPVAAHLSRDALSSASPPRLRAARAGVRRGPIQACGQRTYGRQSCARAAA